MFFRAYEDKGFQIGFANGFEISVMFGKSNYCNRRANSESIATSAEIAVFRGEKTVYADGETPYQGGWLNPNQVAKCVEIVSNLPKSAQDNAAEIALNAYLD